ncbi:MAG: LytTR family DNA-binding domain-containing protein [Traorella sp.]
MKIKLNVKEEHYQQLKQKLELAGFEIDEEADFILSEKETYIRYLTLRNEKNERVNIKVDQIIYIETYGHNVEVFTLSSTYYIHDRLYQLSLQLNPDDFLRISNSVIISKKHVKEIKPTLSMKFIVEMENGKKLDVTRTYYYKFKEAFHI